MMRLKNMIPIIYLFTYAIFLSGTTSASKYNTFTKTLEFFENQNSRKCDSVVILNDISMDQTDKDTLNQIIHSSVFTKDNNFMQNIVPHQNTSEGFITNVNRVLNQPSYTIIVVLGFKKSILVQNIISNLSDELLRNYTWLFVNPYDEKNSSSVNYFKQSFEIRNDQKITFDSQMYVLNGNVTHASLVEVYKTCRDTPLIIRKLVVMSDENEAYLESMNMWSRRNDLMGCSLRVAYIDRFPYISMAESDEDLMNRNVKHIFKSGNTTMYGGMLNSIEMIKLLASDLNFTVSWVHAKDNSYGIFNKQTGKWDGLIGLMMDDKADLSNDYLIVTPSRSRVISFTVGFASSRYGLFMKIPSRAASWDTFVNVFSPQYWFALLIVAIISAFTLVLFYGILNPEPKSQIKNKFVNYLGSGTSVILLSLGELDVFTSMIKRLCSTNAFKCLIIVICVFGLINKEAYTGGLISSLIYHNDAPDINVMEDLVTKPGYQLILRNGTASVPYFSLSTEYPHKQIWETQLKNNNLAYTVTAKVAEKRLLEDKKYVYFDILKIPETLFKGYPCNIIRSDKTYFHRSVALGLKKNSPYLGIFNYKLLLYVEFGVISNIKSLQKSERHKVKCRNDGHLSVGYEALLSAFVIFGGGLTAAIICCMIEFILFHYYPINTNFIFAKIVEFIDLF